MQKIKAHPTAASANAAVKMVGQALTSGNNVPQPAPGVKGGAGF